MPMVESHGLTKKFGDRTAVEDLNLMVEEGEVLGFIGPNGAGKTTTIRMLSGIISATFGYGVIAGHRTDGDVSRLHEVLGLLTETPGFYDSLSALKNLEYFAGFYDNIDAPSQVEKYLKMMGLWERRGDRVATFSKGMKQKLALARSLLNEPKVLFLDEPASGLDPEASKDVRSLIKRLSGEGRTIFLSTHNLSEAEELCSRIAVVKTRLLALDSKEKLRQRLFRTQMAVQLVAVTDELIKKVSSLPFVVDVVTEGNHILVELKEAENNTPELVSQIVGAGGRIMAVSEEKHSLEEVYLSLVQEENNADAK